MSKIPSPLLRLTLTITSQFISLANLNEILESRLSDRKVSFVAMFKQCHRDA